MLIGPQEINAVSGHCFGLIGGARAVLLALTLSADPMTAEVSNLNQNAIAKLAGITDRSVRRAIKQLVAAGFIEVAGTWQSGTGRPNDRYRLLPHQWGQSNRTRFRTTYRTSERVTGQVSGQLTGQLTGQDHQDSHPPRAYAPALTDQDLDNLTGSDHGEDLTGRLTEANTKAGSLEGVQGETLLLLHESSDGIRKSPKQQSLLAIDPSPKNPTSKKSKKPKSNSDAAPIELTADEREAVEAIAIDETLSAITPADKRPRLARDLVRIAHSKMDLPSVIAAAGAWLRANAGSMKKLGGRYLLNWVTRESRSIAMGNKPRAEPEPDYDAPRPADYETYEPFDPNSKDPRWLAAQKLARDNLPAARAREAAYRAAREAEVKDISPEVAALVTRRAHWTEYLEVSGLKASMQGNRRQRRALEAECPTE